ncbi:MAG TPA: dihydropteroate synthase [bacterium]|nr:dihydropteroate synthase [bacterium]HEX67573.1 dihydropteroate synthase [bacterium]
METIKGGGKMILIGENINVMNKKLRQAFKERNKGPVQEVVKKAVKNGVDYLDLNIGPARKDGPQLMEWLIKTVREITDLPVFLDTTNVEALKVGLEMEGGKAVINSIQVTPERMDLLIPLMKDYNAKCVALLIGSEGVPRDATERSSLAIEFLTRIDAEGIPHTSVFFDPIVLPVPYQQDQVKAVLEFMSLFKEMLPGCLSTCGLSNVSNGAPDNLRPLLNRTYLAMLMKHGLDSAIVDAMDTELIEMAKTGKGKLVEFIFRVMEGEEIDESSLSDEERDYFKTYKVLTGETLYSHSWLKV